LFGCKVMQYDGSYLRVIWACNLDINQFIIYKTFKHLNI
jgi:hypothetical protein